MTSAPPAWVPFATTVLVTAAVTAVAVLLAVSLGGGEKKVERRLSHLHGVDDPQFARELGVLLGPPLLDGNRVRTLKNGDEIFPAMLRAIADARRTITFETYIYWSGDIGRAFADALSQRARAGVKVHVLLDWLGSVKMDEKMLAELTAAGVEVRRFHEPRPWQLQRINNRTHRKLLVVDGALAYTGGVGIAPEWTGHAQDPDHWRDTHFELAGPAVAQVQSVFLDNWTKVTGAVPHGADYFPALAPEGAMRAQMFSSSPTGGSASMELMYLMTIAAATRSIDLSASYFVPSELLRGAMLEAIRRGVRVRIVVPGEHIDSDVVRSASRASWGPLLAAGATIAEYRPTMFHVKSMVVDGLLVSVGSTNFDNRSLRLNDEATLNIYDAGFAAQQTAIFESDLAQATPMSYAQWQARPWREKLGDKVASLLGSQL